MGKGQGLSRRTRWVGAFVVGLMLALAVPSIALASPVAFFQYVNPAPGSSSIATSRMLSVTVYDRYGVRYMSNMTMTLDGVKVAPTWKPWAGYGFRKFTLKYAAMNMSVGTHTVVVRIHDRANHTVNYSWSFTVAPVVSDTVPPITTASGALPTYPGFAALSLAATDAGSGVAHTYWKFDGGPQVEGLSVQVQLTVGSHTVEYWSVDKAGNIEAHKTLSTVVVSAILHKSPTGTKSSVCTSCHGTNLAVTHAAVGCICHTASFLTAEMAPFLVSGATPAECVDCHKGQYAAHSFNETASGHSTTTYGKKGVYTKFDGSQGVTLIDTEEDTVTTDWDLSTVNVFWGSTDPSAPPTAIKGLTKDSVVTCQDCHTGLSAAGPHGAAQNWAIDPNYPYPFKYAIVGGPAGAVSFTNPALNYRAGGGVTAATPATLSAGIPASASGIKARIASNLSTSTNAPVQIKSTNPADLMITNYNNYPDGRGAEYIADATSGQYAVICAKCHDLYNGSVPTTSAVDNGWGNSGTDSYEGLHGAHAGGTARNGNDLGRIDGRSDCAACHVAIPHGWRQPRLLVNGFTGNYKLGGSWDPVNKVVVGTTDVASVADPFPYFQGRGMPFSTGVGVMAPAPAVSPGNGPNDAKDDHSANAFGKPVWEEAACISCSGANTGTALEHRGLTTEPAKLR